MPTWRIDPVRRRAYEKAYRARHPDRLNAAKIAYRAAHPERVRAWRKAYQAKDPERYKARKKAQRQRARARDPEKYRALRRAARARYRARYPEKWRAKRAAMRKRREKEGRGRTERWKARRRARVRRWALAHPEYRRKYWYEGPTNPKGEIQWLRKNQALLRNLKRLLRKRGQDPSPIEASMTPSNSPRPCPRS